MFHRIAGPRTTRPATRPTTRPTIRPAGRAVSLLVVAVLALSGCSSLEGTDGKGYITGPGNVASVDEADRTKTIELEGTDLEGNDISLEDFAGKPVVVNVWWSACPPCRKEQPELNDAAERLDGVAEFVGINIRDSGTAQALGYVRKFEVDYPSFYSPDGKALLPFSGAVPPNAIPSTVVLDGEGRVAATIVGAIPTATTLVNVVEEIAGIEPDGAGAGNG